MKKVITSSSNELVKKIRKLNIIKKYRDESGIFFVEGLRHVIEGLKQNALIEELIICPTLLKSDIQKEIINTAIDRGVGIIEVSETVFRSLANKEGPQGIGAVFKEKWSSYSDMSAGIWVGMDMVQDPGNLGSILRTLDAMGGKGIILIGNCTDPYHPTSVRASMGAIFTQKIIKSTLSQFIEMSAGVKEMEIVGTTCSGGVDYQTYSYDKSVLLLVGSEQKGLDEKLINICTTLIKIPMVGKVDSLNLANATSIILYEIYNQHRNRIKI